VTRARRRTALAAGLTIGLAAVVVAAVLVGSWLSARAAPPPPAVVTKVDQVGDQLAVIQISGAGAQAAAEASRESALRWTLAALAAGLVPLAALSWVLSGRWVRPTEEAAHEDVHDEHSPPRDQLQDLQALRDQRDHDRRHLQEVVHELRTPLAVAATNLDLATTTPGLDAELGDQLAAARRGLERLARTVDDLAAHGRLAVAGDGRVDLAHEVRALAGEHAAMALAHRLAIDVEAPESLVVVADRAAVRTAVGNLLINALRLAPVGSIVRLASGVHADWAWIAVRDEGPGLPDADHERAFHRYWRGRYDLDREAEGHEPRGLGLTIARQLTEAQGGHVTVRSAVGIGSTFVVWLPATADARSQEVVADDGVHHRIDPLPTAVDDAAPAAAASFRSDHRAVSANASDQNAGDGLIGVAAP
jgi:signal transduction histidine kinase